MIDQFTAFETCWFLSPPWRNQIPPVEINLFERVYIKTNRTFGFCCGIQWSEDCWIYTVVDDNEIQNLSQYQIIGTGRLQPTTIEKPAFILGERVMLRSIDDSPKQRLILGAQLLNGSWSYYIEWMSPALEEKTKLSDRLALVPQKDLVRVMF